MSCGDIDNNNCWLWTLVLNTKMEINFNSIKKFKFCYLPNNTAVMDQIVRNSTAICSKWIKNN